MIMQETKQQFHGLSFAGDMMALEWEYINSDYIVRQEYLTYDINSFIADVGGYLGLLLGHSLLSIYEWLMKWICKAVKVFSRL